MLKSFHISFALHLPFHPMNLHNVYLSIFFTGSTSAKGKSNKKSNQIKSKVHLTKAFLSFTMKDLWLLSLSGTSPLLPPIHASTNFNQAVLKVATYRTLFHTSKLHVILQGLVNDGQFHLPIHHLVIEPYIISLYGKATLHIFCKVL